MHSVTIGVVKVSEIVIVLVIEQNTKSIGNRILQNFQDFVQSSKTKIFTAKQLAGILNLDVAVTSRRYLGNKRVGYLNIGHF